MPALEDLWIIGDHFLADIFPTLQSVSNNAKYPMYMYQQYNVAAYYQNPSSMTRNTMNRVLNAAAKGLNERIRLPQYVIIILDIDILNCINFYDYAMPRTFHRCAQWVIKNVNKLFSTRREDLKNKRPGAFCDDTRIIWVNIINRPNICDHPELNRAKILAGMLHFNEVMNHIVSETRFNHAVSIHGLTEQSAFTNLGNISASGQYLYRKELDHMFKKFDRHEINLKPTQPDCGDFALAK